MRTPSHNFPIKNSIQLGSAFFKNGKVLYSNPSPYPLRNRKGWAFNLSRCLYFPFHSIYPEISCDEEIHEIDIGDVEWGNILLLLELSNI